MRYFSISTLFLTLSLIISGCRSEATPTVAPVDLQGTVAAAAFTVIAETQAAIPTATPPPPTATFTDTPLPTPTLLPVQSTGATITPVPNGNSNGGNDPCVNATLPAALPGEPVKIRLDNSTKARLSVSVYLNQVTPQGRCGYRSYTLDPGQSVVISDLVEGCYTIWAWNPDPEKYFIVTNGTNCLTKSSNSTFDISTNSIKLKI